MMSTALTTQDNVVGTSEHGFGGIQQSRHRGLPGSMLNPEMGVLLGFSVKGAAVRFGQRGQDIGDPKWEVSCRHVAANSGSTSVAKDGGCEVMTAGLAEWGIAVKRRGEVGVCWLLGFDHKTEAGSAVNSPLSHFFSTAPNEQYVSIRSGVAKSGRMKTFGRCGSDTAPGSLHPPLRPQFWQSGTMTYNCPEKRRTGAELLDVGAKRVAYTGESSGLVPGSRLGARDDWQCQVGIEMGADSTHIQRGISGQGFVRH